jgi:hypothetical protein
LKDSLWNRKQGRSDVACVLFKALIRTTGLKFTPSANNEFASSKEAFMYASPFDETDIEEIAEKVIEKKRKKKAEELLC